MAIKRRRARTGRAPRNPSEQAEGFLELKAESRLVPRAVEVQALHHLFDRRHVERVVGPEHNRVGDRFSLGLARIGNAGIPVELPPSPSAKVRGDGAQLHEPHEQVRIFGLGDVSGQLRELGSMHVYRSVDGFGVVGGPLQHLLSMPYVRAQEVAKERQLACDLARIGLGGGLIRRVQHV